MGTQFQNIPGWIRHNATLFPYYGTTSIFSDLEHSLHCLPQPFTKQNTMPYNASSSLLQYLSKLKCLKYLSLKSSYYVPQTGSDKQRG